MDQSAEDILKQFGGQPPVDVIDEPTPPPAQPVNADPVPPVNPPAPQFDIAAFNLMSKNFGKEFKDEAEAKDFFGIPTKYIELETTHNLTKKEKEELQKKYEESEKKYNEVGKYVNPRDYFATDEQFKVNQILLKHPDKDPATMLRISSMDISKASDLDLILSDEKLKNPDIYNGFTDEQILEAIAEDQYKGADLNDPESWDATTKIRIAKRLKEIRSEFKSLQEVELPKPIDVEARKAEMIANENKIYESKKAKLATFADQVIDKNLDLTFPDPDNNGTELFKFTPKVTDELKADLAEYIDTLARNGEDLSSDDTANKIAKRREEVLLYQHIPEILKAMAMKVATQTALKYHDQVHNDSPLSTQTAPPAQTDQEVSNAVNKIVSHF